MAVLIPTSISYAFPGAVTVDTLETLKYLKKGGRISKTVAFAGSVLNIKPVLAVIDGEIPNEREALLNAAREMIK